MTELNFPTGYALLSRRIEDFGAFRKRWLRLDALAWFIMLGPGALLALTLLDWLAPMPWYLLLLLCGVAVQLMLYAALIPVLKPVGMRVASCTIFGPGVFLALAALRVMARRLDEGAVLAVDLALTVAAAGWLLALNIGITRAYRLLPRFDIDREALILESLHGSLDNQIIGSLQLGREVVQAQSSGRSVGYSIVFASALVKRTADNIGQFNATGLVDRSKAFRNLSIAGSIVLGFIVLAVAAPRVLAERADRIHDAYATLMDLLFPVSMVVTPGDVAVVRNTPISLGVQIDKARRRSVRLIMTDLKSKAVTTGDYKLDPDHRFVLDLIALESFSYEFEYGGRRSPLHKVLVGDLPAIAAMNTELSYPLYTGMPTRTLVGRIPRIQALQGTEALVSIASTVELDPGRSYVMYSGGEKQELSVTGRFAHFAFRVDQEKDVAIHLTGALGYGFEMREPVTFKVIPQVDTPPRVTLLLSQKTKALGATEDGLPILAEETLHFGLSAIAEDDFGVAEMSLFYKIDTKNKHLENLPQRDPAGYTLSFRIDPSQDRVKHSFTEIFKNTSPPLMPGERVTLTVWAKDNNPSPGLPGPGNPTPGKGKSEAFTFTVVQPDLGTYVEQQFGFGSDPLLGGLKRVQRATNLLIEAQRTTHTEAKGIVEKQDVKSRVGAENWPGGSQDAVGDYFRLLSGEK